MVNSGDSCPGGRLACPNAGLASDGANKIMLATIMVKTLFIGSKLAHPTDLAKLFPGRKGALPTVQVLYCNPNYYNRRVTPAKPYE